MCPHALFSHAWSHIVYHNTIGVRKISPIWYGNYFAWGTWYNSYLYHKVVMILCASIISDSEVSITVPFLFFFSTPYESRIVQKVHL